MIKNIKFKEKTSQEVVKTKEKKISPEVKKEKKFFIKKN